MRKQAESKKEEQNGNGGMDAKLKGEIEVDRIKAETKAKSAEEAHSQRTAQRQVTHEFKMEQDRQKHAFDMEKSAAETLADLQARKAQLDVEIEAQIAKANIEITKSKAQAENAKAAKPKEPASA